MKLKRTYPQGPSTRALEEEYGCFARLLTCDDSTHMAQASAVNYFRRLFTENTDPPKYFDQSLIDDFIRIIWDIHRPGDVRIDAAWAITNLLCSKGSSLTHTIVEKGTIDAFVWCIRTADPKLRDQCIWGIGNISADCDNCKELVRATNIIDVVAKQIHEGSFITTESTLCAVWCCLNILRGGNASLAPRAARTLLSAIAKTMRLFSTDRTILQDSLLTLSLLADDRNFVNFPHHWPAQIDAILNEEGLITQALEAIATGTPSLVSPALRLIGNIITGTDHQTDRVVMRDGFVKLIAQCLQSTVPQVRREAAWIFSNIATGPEHHVDLILRDSQLIDQLLQRLHHDDSRTQKEVCWVFTTVLASFISSPRPKQLSEFLGYGVLAIVYHASQPGADTRLVSKIREVVSAILILHPEFWPIVVKAGAGTTPLLDPPKRKKRSAVEYVFYDPDVTDI